jgi:glycosyltransferase involved in cell wall biosynthesis
MKVLHVIPSVAACRGGPSAAVLAMARHLNVAGVEADIVTTDDDGVGNLNVRHLQFSEFEGTRVNFLPRWSPAVRLLREFQYSADFSRWFRANGKNYDGVHVHAIFSFLSTRAMQLARTMRIPYLVRPLGLLDPWSLKQKWLKKRLYFKVWEAENLRHAAAVHCTSPGERSNVLAVLPRARAELIPHGVDMPILSTELARVGSEKRIIFMSRWHPKKNIPLLLEALAFIRSEPWQLVLAGAAADGYEYVVREKIVELGLEDRVSCPGHVTGEAKARLLYGSDIFVLPSVSENFGIAVAEAAACGLRCVVTPGVDLAEVVRDLGIGAVCEATAHALAAALSIELRYTHDRELAAGRAREHFSWPRNAQVLSTLYADIFRS